MQHDSTVYVGLDVHKDSITVACVGPAPDDPVVDVGTMGIKGVGVNKYKRDQSKYTTRSIILDRPAAPHSFSRQALSSGGRVADN
jgi:hypothetical protein